MNCSFQFAGKDATEDFEEIGHSNAAKEMLAKYVIGDFDVSLLKSCSQSMLLTHLNRSNAVSDQLVAKDYCLATGK